MKPTLAYIIWPAMAGLLAALLILDRWVLPAAGPLEPPQREPVSYAAAVQAATPSVVNIYTAKLVTSLANPLLDDSISRSPSRLRSHRQRIERSLGSGVVVTEQGHVLTNNHVIAGADAIQVLLHDGRSASAVVIGSDTPTDLAVLQVDLPDLQPIALGDSRTSRVGDVVLAIGNPLGFGHSVTQGIISALGRHGLQLNTYEDYIQTDATIHLGNSGGALIDTRGRLLGINTLIYTGDERIRSSGIGISLAIPVDLAIFVMRDLIQYGKVIRGWLGVSVAPTRIYDGDSQPQPALSVEGVATDGPAARAGLQEQDLITHVDGRPVRDGRDTMHRIARLRPGDAVDITVQRDSQTLVLRAIVGVQKQSNPTAAR